MKKMLLKCVAVGVAFLASASFAADPTFQVYVGPSAPQISEHNAIVASLKKDPGLRSDVKGVGLQSDVIGINFTGAPISLVVHDDFTNTDILFNIPSRSSGRYGSIHYIPYRTVSVRNPSGVEVWRGTLVQSFDTISVYLSDNKYVVYDTQNPPPV